MTRASRYLPAVLAVFGELATSGCISLKRDNQYDDKAPRAVQARATLQGVVVLEGGGALTEVRVVAAASRLAQAGTREETSLNESGAFLFELAPDTYNVEVNVPGYSKITLPAISLSPGAVMDVGVISPNAIRAAVTGSVLRSDVGATRDTTPASGARVTLTRSGGGSGAYVAFVDNGGNWRVDGVPAGRYVVSAELSDYAPGYVPTDLEVSSEGTVTASPITLFPASAIVQIQPEDYATSTGVQVQLLAFVEQLTEMRVSLDPNFTNDNFVPFAAQIPFELADQDGEQLVYAQFRDVTGRESDAFFAKVTLDRATPEVLSFSAGSNGFVTSENVTINATGFDALSGIRGYRLSLDGTLDNEPETPLLSRGESLTLRTLQNIGASEGERTLKLSFIDRAGNETSPAQSLTVVKDSLAPTTGSPVMTLQDGSLVSSTIPVTLVFNVTGQPSGEALFVQLANAPGISAAHPSQPLLGPLAHQLAPGPDGARQVCAVFSDTAGNRTAELCTTITLDSTGDVQGQARLSVGTDFSGVTVALSSVSSGFSLSPQTGSTGAFTLLDVPAGDDWRVELSKPDFETIAIAPIRVQGGKQTTLSPTLLRRKEGSLNGTALLRDESAHGGILITATRQSGTAMVRTASTAADGTWQMDGLLDGTYSVTASRDGFIGGSYGSQPVVAFSTYTVPATVTLSPSNGDFTVCLSTDTTCAHPVQATRAGTVRLGIDCAGIGADQYYASESSATPNAGQMLTCTQAPTFNLSAGEGQKTIYVWYSTTGTIGTASSTTIERDETPPTLTSLVLNAGATHTNQSLGQVTATLVASDAGTGVASMDFDNAGGAAFTSTVTVSPTLEPRLSAYAASSTHTLETTIDGLKTVSAQVCDRAGNCSTAQSDSITLDRVAPSALDGALFSINTESPAATTLLSLRFEQGTDAVSYRYGLNSDLSLLQYQQFASAIDDLDFSVPNAQGTRTVYAQFKDAAGNESAVFSDSVVIDTEAPTSPAVTLTALDSAPTPDAGWTRSSTIRLDLSASGATAVQYANNAAFTSASGWQTLSSGTYTETAWALGSVEGERIVYARFRDAAGNISSIASASIVLDLANPIVTSLSLDSGTAFSLDNDVVVTSNALDNLTAVGSLRVLIETTSTCLGTPSSAYLNSTVHALDPIGAQTAGSKTVCMKVRDRSGRQSSVVTATITRDVSAPSTPTITIGGTSPGYTRQTLVNLTLSGTDDTAVTEMRLSEDSGFSGAQWEPFQLQRAYLLSSTNGTKTVYVMVRDGAQRTSASQSATIVLDDTPPQIASLTAKGDLASINGYTNDNTADVTLAASDNLTAASSLTVHLFHTTNAAPDPVCSTGTFAQSMAACAGLPCAKMFDEETIAGTSNGTYKIYACVRDAAGNVSPAPTLTTIVRDNNNNAETPNVIAVPGSDRIFVSWQAFPASDIQSYRVVYSYALSPWVTVATSADLPATTRAYEILSVQQRQPHHVAVLAVDYAGNVSNIPAAPPMVIPGFTTGRASGSVGVARGTGTLAPQLLHVGNELWMLTRDGTSSYNQLRLQRCNFTLDDCRIAGAWSTDSVTLTLGPSERVSAVEPQLFVTTHYAYIAFTMRDAADQGIVRLLGCRRSTGCRTGIDWANSFDIAGPSAMMDAIATAHNSQYLAVSWVSSSRTRVRLCRLGQTANPTTEVPCTQGAHWNAEVDLAESFLNSRSADSTTLRYNPALAMTDSALFVANQQTTGGTQINLDLYQCNLTTGCPSFSTSTLTLAASGMSGPSLLATDTRLWLSIGRATNSYITSCALTNGGCGSLDPAIEFTSSGNVAMVRLAHVKRQLYMMWHNTSDDRIEYRGCSSPDSGTTCMTSTNWFTHATLEPNLPLRTVPRPAVVGQNLFVAYADTSNSIRFRMPYIFAPFDVGGAGYVESNTGYVQASWSGLPEAEGFEQAFGSSEAMTNVIAVGATNVSSSAGTGQFTPSNYTAVRTILGGQRSEQSRLVKTKQPYSNNVDTFYGTLGAVAAGPCAGSGSTGCKVISGTGNTNGTRYMAWHQYDSVGAGNYLQTWTGCNASNTCATTRIGTDVGQLASSVSVVNGGSSARAAWVIGSNRVLMQNVTLNTLGVPTMVAGLSCDLSTTADVTNLPVAITAYGSGPFDDWAFVYRGGAAPSAGRLTVRVCESADNCTPCRTNSLTLKLAAEPTPPTIVGYGVGREAARMHVVGVVDLGTSDLRLRQTSCEGNDAETCATATEIPSVRGIVPGSFAAAADQGSGTPGIYATYAANGQQYVAYCKNGIGNCDGNRWTVVRTGFADTSTQYSASIVAHRGVIAVYSYNLNQYRLSTCRTRCYDESNWMRSVLNTDSGGQAAAASVPGIWLSGTQPAGYPFDLQFGFVKWTNRGSFSDRSEMYTDAIALPYE